MTKVTLIKANTSLELPYSFIGSVHYHDGKKNVSMHADSGAGQQDLKLSVWVSSSYHVVKFKNMVNDI